MELFLLEKSLEDGKLLFSQTPDPEKGEWAVCSTKLTEQAIAGRIEEQIHIIQVSGISTFPFSAVLRSEFCVVE